MTTFDIAHIYEQGVDVVVVFVDPAVAHQSSQEQNRIAAALQYAASSAGLKGNIAMVWPEGFWAPRNQHAFFSSPDGSYFVLSQRVNRTLRIADAA